MGWFVSGGIAAYAVHIGMFYALTALDLPKVVAVAVISMVLAIMAGIKFWRDEEDGLACIGGGLVVGILLPGFLLALLCGTETSPNSGRVVRAEWFGGSFFFLVAFYLPVFLHAKPALAILIGGIALAVQLLVLWGARPEFSLGTHRMGNSRMT